MPPRLFPQPFHIGTDICSIERIARLITKTHAHPNRAENFISRILRPEEREAYKRQVNLALDPKIESGVNGDVAQKQRRHQTLQAAHFMAGRFAAKEAVIKAWGSASGRKLGWKEICILPSVKALEGVRPHDLNIDTEPKVGELKERLTEDELNTNQDVDSEIEVRKLPGRLRIHKGPEALILQDKERTFRPPVAFVLPAKDEGTPWQESEETIEVRISISHDAGFATAVCIACDDSAGRRKSSDGDNAREDVHASDESARRGKSGDGNNWWDTL